MDYQYSSNWKNFSAQCRVIMRLVVSGSIHRARRSCTSTKVYEVEYTASKFNLVWRRWYTNLHQGLDLQKAEPMKKSMRLDRNCVLIYYIGVYMRVAKNAENILKLSLRRSFGDAASLSLSTWSLLCDGRRGSNVVFPFLYLARCRDTVVRVNGGAGTTPCGVGPNGHYSIGCSLRGENICFLGMGFSRLSLCLFFPINFDMPFFHLRLRFGLDSQQCLHHLMRRKRKEDCLEPPLLSNLQ
jgi:hypothetical protein